MEGLKTGFALRTILSQRKASLLCFLPLLLLVVFLSFTLLPTIWLCVLTGFLEGPAFAFLLLNCVIATIVGSSKMENERRGHKEDTQEELAVRLSEEGDEQAKDSVESGSFCCNTPLKNGHSHHKQKGEIIFLRRNSSLNGSSDYQAKHEQVKAHYKKEKKPISSRARLASRRNEKTGHFPTKLLGNEVQRRQLIRGSLTSFHDEAKYSDQGLHEAKPAPDDHCTDGHKSHDGHAVDLTDHQQQQAQSSAHGATSAHPSMDEVWAAIMSSKTSDDRMAFDMLHAEKTGKKRDSKLAKQPLPAASTGAPIQAAAPLHTQPAAATTAATSSLREADKPAGKALTTPGVRRVPGGNEEENGYDELKELNRRAEQFISRFNRQMRLQREESWQRQNRTRHLLLPLSL